MTTVSQDSLLHVDSYGCIFMYTTHRDLTTAPRHIIRMSEPVDPIKLLGALNTALVRFPQMALGLTRGARSYAYHRISRPPVVLPFDDRSPYYIGSEDTNGYLFLCGYRDNTIYLEYQHCTADGRGFDQFIRCVLFYYLKYCGKPVKNDGTVRTLETVYTPEEGEDGYVRLRQAPQSDAGHLDEAPAFHLDCQNDEDSDEMTTELTLSLAALKGFLKPNGLSPLPYLMTALSHGIYRTYYAGTDRREAVIAEVPMDLRARVPSETTRFYVALLDLPFRYEYFSLPFVEACRKCKETFDTQKALPHAAWWALKNATRVAEAHVSDMPIGEKERMMREQARSYIRRDSFILTNIGAFEPPACMQPYILDYSAILPSAHQPFGVLVSSYQDTLKVSLSQRDFDPRLVHNVAAVLQETGMDVHTMSYPFHVTRYDGLRLAKEG